MCIYRIAVVPMVHESSRSAYRYPPGDSGRLKAEFSQRRNERTLVKKSKYSTLVVQSWPLLDWILGLFWIGSGMRLSGCDVRILQMTGQNSHSRLNCRVVLIDLPSPNLLRLGSSVKRHHCLGNLTSAPLGAASQNG